MKEFKGIIHCGKYTQDSKPMDGLAWVINLFMKTACKYGILIDPNSSRVQGQESLIYTHAFGKVVFTALSMEAMKVVVTDDAIFTEKDWIQCLSSVEDALKKCGMFIGNIEARPENSPDQVGVRSSTPARPSSRLVERPTPRGSAKMFGNASSDGMGAMAKLKGWQCSCGLWNSAGYNNCPRCGVSKHNAASSADRKKAEERKRHEEEIQRRREEMKKKREAEKTGVINQETTVQLETPMPPRIVPVQEQSPVSSSVPDVISHTIQPASPQVFTSEQEKIQLLKDYKELLDSGIITEEEFNAKKNQILNS